MKPDSWFMLLILSGLLIFVGLHNVDIAMNLITIKNLTQYDIVENALFMRNIQLMDVYMIGMFLASTGVIMSIFSAYMVGFSTKKTTNNKAKKFI